MGAVPDAVGNEATFASFRETAWHGLGTVFTETITDSGLMLAKAYMANQNIRKAPITIEGIAADGWANDKVALIGDDALLGVPTVRGFASPDYEIMQPEEYFEAIQLAPGMRWETAGQMREGRQFFGAIAFEQEIVLDPTGVADKTIMFLMVAGSWDGSLSNYFGMTPVRVVCENTLNVAIAGAQNMLKTKSTKNIRDRISEWQKAVAMSNKYIEVFNERIKEMYEAPMTRDSFVRDVVPAIYGERPTDNIKGRETKWDNNLENLMAIWNGPTVSKAGIANTKWGAFNTLTENNQWNRQVRGGNLDNFRLAGAGFDNATNKFRQDALKAVLAA